MKEKVDRYLKKGASYKRLLAEYKKHNTLVIGFDFNSTVHDYYKVGESYEMVRRLLRDLKSINCKCICWTTYKDPEYVIKFCKENNIPYRAYSAKEIKKFITGNGNASKQAVIDAVNKKYNLSIADDNEADAIALYHLAVEDLKLK